MAPQAPAADLIVSFPASVRQGAVAALFREWTPRIAAQREGRVRIDCAATTTIDSAGAGLVAHWRRVVAEGVEIEVVGATPAVAGVLEMYGHDPDALPASRDPSPTAFEDLGGRAYGARDSLIAFLVLLTDTLYYLPGTLTRRWKKRRALLIEEMVRIGSTSFGIIAFLSFLVGLTMALQAAYQLRQFGANIFIANLVGLSMMREMGPLLTAILLAGRIGSSTAAEIATRVITEEIDALKTLGVDPVEYIVVPKFVAITVTGPLLSVMATVIGIAGGYLVALLYLDLGHDQFMNQLIGSLYMKDLMTGLAKAVSFSWAIVLIGAHKGFQTRGGPLEVGTATTSSVVTSLFAVIVLDAVFSVIFYFG